MRQLFVAIFVGFLVGSVISDAEKNKHVVDQELSDQEHFDGADHNKEYDHEAFLGKEEADTFDRLSPEESKGRLSLIFDKIDTNGDQTLSDEELRVWIKYVQSKYISQDSERQWKEHSVIGDKLAWEDYKKRTYGFLEEPEYKNEYDNYKAMMERDQKRWAAADEDGDGSLDQQQFTNFLHPEEAPHMKMVVVEETIADIDKDKDGQISLEEYIGDMWPNEGKEDEPDWVKSEKTQFAKYRDLDGNGYMDAEEVKKWVLPDDYDHVEAEVKHLFLEADENKDGSLTREEVLEKYDTFVGSQATDYGEVLNRHDEF